MMAASATQPFLKLQGVKKRFGDIETVHGVDLSVDNGELVVFVGPSGCGKSTLLRMIAGLEATSEGAIHIDGIDVTHAPASQRHVAMVFQSYALYPHMTVEENLTFGMRMRGVDKATIAKKTGMAIEILRLEPYLQRKPGALSGGQAQRVAIGRALVQDPAIFLFDEPLSNLDAELRLSMRVELAALHKQLGKTMIYVTHDQVEAMTLADRIVILRDGRIEQIGRPLDLYRHPVNEFVAGFIGSPAMNFLPGLISVSGASGSVTLRDGSSLPLPRAAKATHGAMCKVGVRPEHLQIDESGPLSAKVKVVEQLGATSYVYADWCGQTLCIEARDNEGNLKVGDEIRLRFSGGDWHVFDVNGLRLVES
jgi:ABC-type sugar transport system ATPase subunit